MTVTGTGFNPQNSIILVCGSECAIDRLKSDRTTLLCKIPANNGKLSEKRTLRNGSFYKDHSLDFFCHIFVFFGATESPL